MTTGSFCADSPEVNVFRSYEKLYRRQPVATSKKERRCQRRNEVTADRFSEVVDFRLLDSSSKWHNFVKKIEMRPGPRRRFLDGDKAQMFEISSHPGLIVITDAFSPKQQFEWAKRALSEFSLGPYTNLWSHGEKITPLWRNGMDSRDLAPFKKLRWANIGRHYDWTTRKYIDVKEMPPLDDDLVELFNEAVSVSGVFSKGPAQAGIVNFYPSGTSMGGHLDDAESDMISPIVSLSIGCSCIYLQGGHTRSTAPIPLWLKSGDLTIMGGDARICYHGVPLVTSGTLPDELRSLLESQHPNYVDYLSNARLNINLRSVDLNQ